MITKQDGLGNEVTISESEIYLRAIKNHPDWKTEEIQNAINKLKEYEGFMVCPWSFIKGTIENRRVYDRQN